MSTDFDVAPSPAPAPTPAPAPAPTPGIAQLFESVLSELATGGQFTNLEASVVKLESLIPRIEAAYTALVALVQAISSTPIPAAA